MTNTPNKTTFQNRKKEAGFWKKNFEQTWKDGKPVKVQFARNLSETINVRFDSGTVSALRSRARERGLGATQLIRMWVMERLQDKNRPQAHST